MPHATSGAARRSQYHARQNILPTAYAIRRAASACSTTNVCQPTGYARYRGAKRAVVPYAYRHATTMGSVVAGAEERALPLICTASDVTDDARTPTDKMRKIVMLVPPVTSAR